MPVPGPFCRDRRTRCAGSEPLHFLAHHICMKALVWLKPHISGKCWAYLARATEGVGTDNPISSGFIFARNEAWGMVSAAKPLTQAGGSCCPPPVPSPFIRGMRATGARKEAVVATSGNRAVGKGSCDQPNN